MEAQRIVALLPAGKFFDDLQARVLVPWAESRSSDLLRVDAAEARIGALAPALESAGLVLAEVTGRHARIIYLCGYAQGIGKRVVYLSQFEDAFPFDPAQQTLLVYSGSFEFLRQQLDALDGSASVGKPEGGARERFLATFGEIMRKHGAEHRGVYEMEGSSTFILRDQDLDLPVVQELSRRARELGLRIKLM